MYCANCQNSVYNTMIDGVRVPLVFYMVVGQPADTGPPLGINDPGVKIPSFVRALMLPHVPVARAELCMNCVSLIFGVPLLTAEEDPMYSAEQEAETKADVQPVIEDKAIDEVTTTAKIMERPLLALKVGRGAEKAPKLPKARK
jgi:hypothetical protein